MTEKKVFYTVTREDDKVVLAVRCGDQIGVIRFDKEHESVLRDRVFPEENKPTHIINPGTPNAQGVVRDGHGRVLTRGILDALEAELDEVRTQFGELSMLALQVVDDDVTNDGRCGCIQSDPMCPLCILARHLREETNR